MSGHSKWSTIKHKKGATDAKRGKIFSKLSCLISIAAKDGSDPEMNPRLRMAIDAARKENMPKDNIERAIRKGAGGIEGEDIEEIIYEAYGPSGVAIILEIVTNNRNRTIAEIRHTLKQFGGKLAEGGSVLYLFNKKENEWEPKYPLEISDQKIIGQVEKLFEALDENDDVQEIYSNLKT